jgi:hypothetical protein
MRKLALLTISAAALFVTAGAASAQYYSGPGFGVQIGPRYEDSRYRYNDDRRYDRRYERRAYRGARCPRNYTVQDGVCKPYTGR